MGVIRKTLSLSTCGLIDFRSDKERIARYTKQTRDVAREQAAKNAREQRKNAR